MVNEDKTLGRIKYLRPIGHFHKDRMVHHANFTDCHNISPPANATLRKAKENP